MPEQTELEREKELEQEQNDSVIDAAVEKIEDALERHDVGSALNTLEALEDDDKFEVFDELEVEAQAELLPRLSPETGADILVELHEDDQNAIAQRVDDESLGEILDEMEPDDAADVIGELSEERQQRVLAEMDTEAADDVRALLIYPDESAGGLMTNSFLALRPEMTAGDAINALRKWGPDNETAYYLYVVDRDRHLVGIVSLRMLITAKPTTLLRELMNPDVVSVPVGTDQEEFARLRRKVGFLVLPVVDAQQRLVGVITADDIVDVIEEEATEDAFRLTGMPDEERVFSSLGVSLQKRLPWLLINLPTAFLAAWVSGLFEGVLQMVPILGALQTIVAGQGGVAVTQRITVIVRGIALGEVDLSDAAHVIGKELLVSLLQGLAIALVCGLGVMLWQHNTVLGLVMSVSMLGNMLIAGLVGASIPFILRKFRIDPALASSVIATTFTDCCGFAFSLGLATLLLRYLL